MYSGITQGCFPVVSVDAKPGLLTYEVELNDDLVKGLKVGASVSVDGVCQTVVRIDGVRVQFNAMEETLNKTTLDELVVGRRVSIERSLKMGDEMGGHEMAGHVEGTGVVHQVDRGEGNGNLSLVIQCPPEWMKYILSKGFIGVEGSSLTVGEVDSDGFFTLHLIPETLRLTNLGNKQVGDRVNIELDHRTKVIVETVERVMGSR